MRFLGTFLEDPAAVPQAVVEALASQVKVVDSACVSAYRDSEQRWRHTAEIRTRYGYREFVDKGVRFRLGRWLCAMCWTGTDRPSVLFDHASAWLIGHKVLLPGVTILERFIAEIRARMEIRLWTLLGQTVNADQRSRFEKLLTITDEGGRQSWFDKLRKGPVRISAPALMKALERIETVRALGITLPAASNIPQSRLASLARFAGTTKITAINRLPAARRMATLVAFMQLNAIANHQVKLSVITPHWNDVLRLIGSLKLGRVPATDVMRTLQVGDRATPLALALAEVGRIDKTIHTLNFIDDESRRRSTLVQLNLGEGRHTLARVIFHGKRGELYQRYREGQEDQLSALGLVVNVVVLWNTIYMDAVLTQLRKEGHSVLDEDVARLSPFGHEHINMLGHYSFAVHDSVARGELRPLRSPSGNP